MSAPKGLVRLGEKEHRGLDVDDLKRDLRNLWREEGKSADRSGGVTRACHSTLALAAAPEEDPDDLVADLVQVHPARVILVRSDPRREPGHVEAWVSASCVRRPGVVSLLCSEVIQMAAGPETGARVASAIRSLAVGGLPLAAFSERVSPLELDWVGRLETTLDRVLADSEFLGEADGLHWWRHCVASAGTRPWTGDALWARLLDWRRSMASWFDHPDRRLSLADLRAVEIEVTAAPGGALKAWLLVGWLGSRLRWDPASVRRVGDGITVQSQAGDVRVAVTARRSEDPGVCLHGVRFSFGTSPSVSWRRHPGERAIVVEDANGRPVFRYHEAKTGRAAAAVQLLRLQGTDRVATEAMAFALRLGGEA